MLSSLMFTFKEIGCKTGRQLFQDLYLKGVEKKFTSFLTNVLDKRGQMPGVRKNPA